MAGRHQAKLVFGLQARMKDNILPSVLDDTVLRRGVRSGFGLVLNLHLFKPEDVSFILMKDRFFRVQAVHRGKPVGNTGLARMTDLSFHIPECVNMKNILVEWYKDDFVHVRERGHPDHPDPPQVALFQNDEVMIEEGVIAPPSPPASDQAATSSIDVGIRPPAASSSEGFRKGLIEKIENFNEEVDMNISFADNSSTQATSSSNAETSESNVKDASTQGATDKPKATRSQWRPEMLLAYIDSCNRVARVPREVTVPSPETGINFKRYCEEVQRRFQSTDKGRGVFLTPRIMETSYRKDTYDTEGAIRGFYQARQDFKNSDGTLPNFLYDTDYYERPVPYIFS